MTTYYIYYQLSGTH